MTGTRTIWGWWEVRQSHLEEEFKKSSRKLLGYFISIEANKEKHFWQTFRMNMERCTFFVVFFFLDLIFDNIVVGQHVAYVAITCNGALTIYNFVENV